MCVCEGGGSKAKAGREGGGLADSRAGTVTLKLGVAERY